MHPGRIETSYGDQVSSCPAIFGAAIDRAPGQYQSSFHFGFRGRRSVEQVPTENTAGFADRSGHIERNVGRSSGLFTYLNFPYTGVEPIKLLLLTSFNVFEEI